MQSLEITKRLFWVKNMSGINWKKIFARYDKLIDRVGTKSEFSDLAWEMQGELEPLMHMNLVVIIDQHDHIE